jgi:LmbE family N-acetylglucosaminyl deacetylase
MTFDAFLKEQRLLVVAPHSDDETAGAGGLIARVKAAGGKAFVMVMSTGELDHFDGKPGATTHGNVRARELAAAMKTLEVDDFEIVMENSDRHLKLDMIPRMELTNLIERQARLSTQNTDPTMIVFPAPSYNQDHEAVYKAGITACRPHLPAHKSFQRFVLVADAPQLAWSTPPFFRPNFYVDISGAALDRKIRAYQCHESQLRPSPSPASVESLKMLAEMRGREISVTAAEAFECYRFVI